jgi:hypothetical protein
MSFQKLLCQSDLTWEVEEMEDQDLKNKFTSDSLVNNLLDSNLLVSNLLVSDSVTNEDHDIFASHENRDFLTDERTNLTILANDIDIFPNFFVFQNQEGLSNGDDISTFEVQPVVYIINTFTVICLSLQTNSRNFSC